MISKNINISILRNTRHR